LTLVYAGLLRRVAALVYDAFLLAIVLWACFFTAVMFTFLFLLWIPAFLVIAVLYFPLFQCSKRQATPGQSAFGIKVTDLAGARIRPLRAFARFLAGTLTIATLGIGLLVAAWTAKRQALHDLVAATLVVDAKATPEQVAAGGGTMRASAGVWIADVAAVLAVVLIVSVVIPLYQSIRLREPVNELLQGVSIVRMEVQEALLAGRAPPERPAQMPAHAKSVVIKPDGAFVVEVDPELFEGRFIFKPLKRPDGNIDWECAAQNVPSQAIPAVCRN